MAEAKPLKIQRGDKSLDRANRVVATRIIFHTRRKKARLIPAHPGLEGTIRHTESYTALHKRLGSCPASSLHPGCNACRSKTRRSFGCDVAEQQACAEQQHEAGGGEFDAAHEQCAAA